MKIVSELMPVLLAVPLAATVLAGQATLQKKKPAAVSLETPSSLRAEHAELHAALAEAIRSGGETGKAAEIVEKKLHPHFMSEEEYAMPPLGLLDAAAHGKPIPEATRAKAIQMSERLKKQYPKMLAEHGEIVKALAVMKSAALKENKPAQVAFVEKLQLHAKNEEQVLYPAALLVGQYLKVFPNR